MLCFFPQFSGTSLNFCLILLMKESNIYGKGLLKSFSPLLLFLQPFTGKHRESWSTRRTGKYLQGLLAVSEAKEQSKTEALALLQCPLRQGIRPH